MKDGKDIDKLFKDGLENPDLPFNDLDWDDLEERLHPTPKRRIVPLIWLTAVAGIAAMLLVVFLLVKPGADKADVKAVVKTNKSDQNNNQLKNNPESVTKVPESVNDGGATTDSASAVAKNAGKKTVATGVTAAYERETVRKVNETVVDQSRILADVTYNPNLSTKTDPVEFRDQKLSSSVAIGRPERIKPSLVKQKSRFVLSILAAPDLTSVQKSGQSSLSGGFGVEATYILTKKLSITTGAAYAKKIYDSDFSLYRPNTSYLFTVAPSNIHANCDVIDIPLNVNYKVFGNNRNAISVSTGLSSYIMLKEKYSYSYTGGYEGPQGFEVKGRNQHYLGIANVGVEFQRKINNNLSISAKPFMKIPLTDIGYGNSKLMSTGVAVSVNMNLFNRN
ncbi:hypothetical protein ASE74_03195 [Pedobacter sp. Leaf216]|uniref:hypothetical protein n=1 Tax=Pedobacter sp. Leaf216 TaxID=1735684 RepID=UPI0006F95CD0|nr:hypothetical protein [Pedobacter sp. Leaf216]KQM74997.1 hypothetical protein ASE74_03195 [Pedobacter sp. Leaf216]